MICISKTRMTASLKSIEVTEAPSDSNTSVKRPAPQPHSRIWLPPSARQRLPKHRRNRSREKGLAVYESGLRPPNACPFGQQISVASNSSHTGAHSSTTVEKLLFVDIRSRLASNWPHLSESSSPRLYLWSDSLPMQK